MTTDTGGECLTLRLAIRGPPWTAMFSDHLYELRGPRVTVKEKAKTCPGFDACSWSNPAELVAAAWVSWHREPSTQAVSVIAVVNVSLQIHGLAAVQYDFI